ncbi:YvrJ family protein [Ammoniphilus sp. CFH 90114]|nr:YvrJ family protein [Ammoniphilus sp. CFH 90114]
MTLSPSPQSEQIIIFVSWYLLTRVESKMEALTFSIADMTHAIHGWEKET